MKSNKPKILLFCDWFPPAFRAGGPVQSCYQFCVWLSDHFDIWVVTGNTDLGVSSALDGIISDEWILHEKGFRVRYVSTANQSGLYWKLIIKEISPDIIYLNSMFSPRFSLLPLLIIKRMRWKGKVVLAPRGMLKQSALSFKPFKKKIFLSFFRIAGIGKRIYFQATDNTEYKDIKVLFPGAMVVQTFNLPCKVAEAPVHVAKKEQCAKFLFVGRIHPIKNIDWLLSNIVNVKGQVDLTVAGPYEDEDYLKLCQQLADKLPPDIKVKFVGEVPHEELTDLVISHHALILPTRGENFGHSIFEHLSKGRPVIISDQTPWRNLQTKNAGWDITLDKPTLFLKAMQEMIDADQLEYDKWSLSAWTVASEYVHNANILQPYFELFTHNCERRENIYADRS